MTVTALEHLPICTTCGVQYSAGQDRDHCTICEDFRQYVNPAGQEWTDMQRLRQDHQLIVHKMADNIYELWINPDFGIGQRAFFIKTKEGNIFWDSLSLLDDTTAEYLSLIGGVDHIAISHPHFYSSMHSWADYFDAEIHVHEDDKDWVEKVGHSASLWTGDKKQLTKDVQLIRCGGHFDGSCILHMERPNGNIIFTADTLSVNKDGKSMSFMKSYPNYIPLSISELKAIKERMEGVDFEMVHGGFRNGSLIKNGRRIFEESLDRDLKARSLG